jgi:Domain of unknown function (DUF4383)
VTRTQQQSQNAEVDRDRARSRIQLVTVLVGSAFIVVGILGFIPGVTTHFHGTGGMTFNNHASDYNLFGVFQVSVFHNGVHLLFGGVGLLCAFTPPSARLFLIGGGAVYLVLWVYGLVIDRTSDANFIPVNTADNWLHFALGAAMVALGVVLGRQLSRGERAAR